MNEKKIKLLRRGAKGCHMTRRGMSELRRLYLATPRKERARFKIQEAIRILQRQEFRQRTRVAERVQAFKDVLPRLRSKRRRQFWAAIPMAMAMAAWWRGGR